eukprot:gene10462-biopygen15334
MHVKNDVHPFGKKRMTGKREARHKRDARHPGKKGCTSPKKDARRRKKDARLWDKDTTCILFPETCILFYPRGGPFAILPGCSCSVLFRSVPF